LVVVLIALLRSCGEQHPSTLAVAVQTYDSASHTIEGRIDGARATANAAARAESAAMSRVSSLKRSLTHFSSDVQPQLQVDPRIDSIVATQDSALALAHVQIAALDTALDLSELRAASADSLLHVAVREASAKCRIAWVVPCPSRRVAAALGAVGGLVVAVRVVR
jgi:hypothetical protein